MKTFTLIGIAIIALSLSGCETAKGLLGPLGPMLGIVQNKIETSIAAEAAGEYVAEIRKDGKVLVSESWTCTRDSESGKLTGCHKK